MRAASRAGLRGVLQPATSTTRGYLLCVEPLGGNERRPRRRHRELQRLAACTSTPSAATTGVLALYRKAWGGWHLRQFTRGQDEGGPARPRRDVLQGSSSVTFDWQHNAEGSPSSTSRAFPTRATWPLANASGRFAGSLHERGPRAPPPLRSDGGSTRSSAASSTAARAPRSARRRRSTGPATRSTSSTGSGSATAEPHADDDARPLQRLQRHHRRPSAQPPRHDPPACRTPSC